MILRHIKTGVTIDMKEWEVVDGEDTLFITSDGVGMVLGQKFWFVVRATLDIFSGNNYVKDSKCIYFSTEKRAEEYVEEIKNKIVKERNI
jgi:hypothetical protein